MKIGIAMPCYDRESQLKLTLEKMSQSKHKDWHLTIVDDASPTPLPPSLLTDLPATLISIPPSQKTWINPLIPTNMAIAHLLKNYTPDIVIIQCAECYYVGDVLSYAATHVTDKNYISFGCLSFERTDLVFPDDQLIEMAKTLKEDRKRMWWYNHPKHRPAALEWCTAMSTKTMLLLNGHDERFKDAMGRADRDIVRRAKLLGRRVEITTNPFVVHQFHSRHYRRTFPTNKSLYDGKIKKEKNTRARHIITEDFS